MDLFKTCTMRVVPFTYRPEMSVYEILCKMADSLNQCISILNEIDADQLQSDIEDLTDLLAHINSTDYPETIASINSSIAVLDAAAGTTSETLRDVLHTQSLPMTPLGTLPLLDGYTPQGMEAVGDYIYYVEYSASQINVVKIRKGTLERVDEINVPASSEHFTHGNSVSYQSSENALYITGGSTRLLIVSLNPFEIASSRQIAADMPSSFSNVTFDLESPWLVVSTQYYGPVGFCNRFVGDYVCPFRWFDLESVGVLQDGYAHNNKFYLLEYAKYKNVVRCYAPYSGVNYISLELPKAEEGQGLTRDDSNGHFLVSFVDGQLFDLGVLPTTQIAASMSWQTRDYSRYCMPVNLSELDTYTVQAATPAVRIMEDIPIAGYFNALLGQPATGHIGNHFVLAPFNRSGFTEVSWHGYSGDFVQINYEPTNDVLHPTRIYYRQNGTSGQFGYSRANVESNASKLALTGLAGGEWGIHGYGSGINPGRYFKVREGE